MSDNLNDTIYRKYRSIIRNLRKAQNGGGRTAERKQTALKQVADTFGIRIGEIKNIVRAMDAKNGVTHEHPEPYRLERQFEDLFEEARLRLGHVPCEVCALSPEDNLVRPRLTDRLDPAESHMRDFLAKDVRLPLFTADISADDFHQLCYLCKLKMVGYRPKAQTV